MQAMIFTCASGIGVLACTAPLQAEPVAAHGLFFAPAGAAAMPGASTEAEQVLIAVQDHPVRSESSRPSLPEPTRTTQRDLSVTLADRNDRARIEIGALGGGRREAPALFHVGLGLDF